MLELLLFGAIEVNRHGDSSHSLSARGRLLLAYLALHPGKAVVSARIAEMVLRDERAVVPIGSYHPRFGVTLSLPSIVGRGGVIRSFEPEMSREEAQALMLGAANLRKAEGRN